MELQVHLNRGDGTTAEVIQGSTTKWLSIFPKGQEAEITFFIPEELTADAESFAESVNQYCRRRGRVIA